jgi:hypothetical protein
LELAQLTTIPIAKGLPAGAVGRIAANLIEAPTLVREMIDHHEHYRRTSTEFAASCRARHTAAGVLRHLLAD